MEEKVILKRLKRFVLKTIFMCFSVEKCLKKRDALYKSIPYSNMITNSCGIYGSKEIMPKEWFDDTVELNFEGITVKAPLGYDLYLKQVYGNYMELPPVEKRQGHHYVDFFDLEKSYREYRV